jgi:predicted TIM-barrel fold metal-dependent hydrolase
MSTAANVGRIAEIDRPTAGAMSLIALEEHFAWDPASAGNVVATWLPTNNEVAYRRLYDRGPLRLEQMDTAGIDFQILSLFDPGVQEETDVARAIDLARRANDELADTVRGNPHRFGGFATLATQDPDAAARIGACGYRIGPCRWTHQWAHPGALSRRSGV